MDGVLLDPSLYTIKSIAILNSSGRVLVKYYDKNILPTTKEQIAFEKNLWNKTYNVDGEIIMLDGLTIIYRQFLDVVMYVMGSSHENELLLLSVLDCLCDTINHLCKKDTNTISILQSLDIAMLALDEMCDGGIIMDADPNSIISRVALRNDDVPLGEQTVAQVLQTAKEQLMWSILK